MAGIEAGQGLIKTEAQNTFKSNLISAMFSGVEGNNNVPKFTGQAGNFTNPNAIDPGQLDPTTQPGVSIPNTLVDASDTYGAMKAVVDNLTRIRYYTSNWYFQTNDTQGFIATKSGTAIFKATIPALPAYSAATKTNGYSGWNRTVEGSGAAVTSAIKLTGTTSVTADPVVTGKLIEANKVSPYTTANALFKKLFDAWTTFRNKRITYTYYTCHSNCHSNWDDSRSRR